MLIRHLLVLVLSALFIVGCGDKKDDFVKDFNNDIHKLNSLSQVISDMSSRYSTHGESSSLRSSLRSKIQEYINLAESLISRYDNNKNKYELYWPSRQDVARTISKYWEFDRLLANSNSNRQGSLAQNQNQRQGTRGSQQKPQAQISTSDRLLISRLEKLENDDNSLASLVIDTIREKLKFMSNMKEFDRMMNSEIGDLEFYLSASTEELVHIRELSNRLISYLSQRKELNSNYINIIRQDYRFRNIMNDRREIIKKLDSLIETYTNMALSLSNEIQIRGEQVEGEVKGLEFLDEEGSGESSEVSDEKSDEERKKEAIKASAQKARSA